MDMLNFVKSVVDAGQLQVLAYLVMANLILGVVAAIVKGTFELNKLVDFWKRVVMVFGSYLAVSLASKAMADLEVMRTSAWIALLAFMSAQIIGNLRELGLPIPAKITKFIERK